MDNTIYDLVIIGSGPAGLSAGIYAGRNKLNTLIIEKGTIGGQIVLTSAIENYPGTGLNAESGVSLIAKMKEQAEYFGSKILAGEVSDLKLKGNVKTITLRDKREINAKTVIIASGASPRHIDCINEDKFIGAGISFCASCDANFFAGLAVYVVGGGESALEEALFLTKYASHVTIIHRRDKFRASPLVIEKADHNDKISFMLDSIVTKVDGEDVLTNIFVKNVKTGEEKIISAQPANDMLGLFEFIGMEPHSDIYALAGVNLKDTYIDAGEDTHTNIPGVFAAGDIRYKSLRQVVTAVGDGAVAAMESYKYIDRELK